MKDYTLLKDKLSKESQITTKDIIALGFSQYDIKLFVENNILTKVSRGLYYYRPSLVDEPKKVEKVEEQSIEETPSIAQEELSKKVNYATTLMIKKEPDAAISTFEEILKIDSTNQYVRFAIFACYMFKQDFITAYNKLIEVYNNRQNDELLLNLYNYMLMLKELTPVDEKILNDIANIISTEGSNIKKPKQGTYLHKLSRAIHDENWEKALKYSSINVSIDKNQKKYRLTNQCYRYLVIAVIQSKNLVFEKPQEEPAPKIDFEEEQTIIVPTSPIEQTIKQNLLLEAINNNDYQTALSILEQEQIDNPELIIKTLLTKLHTIQSLITTSTPIKITATEEVRLVDENQLALAGFADIDKQPVISAIPEQFSDKAVSTQETSREEVTNSADIPNISQLTPTELIDTAYKAYKDFLETQNFQEARRNLQRYEYLNNQQGTHRNIKYHYNRIAMLEQEYKSNPDRYFKKQELKERIFQAKRRKEYEEALSLIAEYKNLGGIIHPSVQVTEIEIYIALNKFNQAELALSNLKDNEEPAYYLSKARIYYEHRRFEECITMCIAYNDRRPSSSAANYIMMSNCYKCLQKPGKAIKALRKAEEINRTQNYTKDLSSDIAALEMQAENKKEQRLALTPKKK